MSLNKKISYPGFWPCSFLSYWRSSQSCVSVFGNADSPFKPMGIQAVMLVLKAFLKIWFYISVRFTCSLIYFLCFQCEYYFTQKMQFLLTDFEMLDCSMWILFYFLNFTSFLVGRVTTSSLQMKQEGMLWQGALICFIPLLRLSLTVA